MSTCGNVILSTDDLQARMDCLIGWHHKFGWFNFKYQPAQDKLRSDDPQIVRLKDVLAVIDIDSRQERSSGAGGRRRCRPGRRYVSFGKHGCTCWRTPSRAL